MVEVESEEREPCFWQIPEGLGLTRCSLASTANDLKKRVRIIRYRKESEVVRKRERGFHGVSR